MLAEESDIFLLKKLLKLHYVTQNSIIYKLIMDLGVHHDTRCEKYCKQSETNG